MDVQIYKPPKPIPPNIQHGVFLAGSIEMGMAENWQKKAEDFLLEMQFNVFNPRRDDWDSSWEQSINYKQFREQVEWELDAMDWADFIIMYFSPGTKSPITLLELGLYANSGKLIVACPVGYWRRGNVEIVCDKYATPFYDTLEDMLGDIVQEASMTKKATMDARVAEIVGYRKAIEGVDKWVNPFTHGKKYVPWVAPDGTQMPYPPPFISAPTHETEGVVRDWVAQQGFSEDIEIEAIGDIFWGRIFENQDPILAALEYKLGDYAHALLAVEEANDG